MIGRTKPANSNANSVTEKMEWHAIVRETFAEFPSHGSAFNKEEESGKIHPSLLRLHARKRHAHSDLAYRDLSRNFANFGTENDEDRHYCYASRIENFLISHQSRSIPSILPKFNLTDRWTQNVTFRKRSGFIFSNIF